METAAPRRSLPRLALDAVELLASHDAASLAALLQRAGGPATTARATAAKVIKHAFGGAASPPAWDARALEAIGVGAWARPALLGLDPSISLAIAEAAPSADDTIRLALRARDGS